VPVPPKRSRTAAPLALSFPLAVLASLGAAVAACGHGEFVWYQDLPATAVSANGEYLIGIGDIVSIKVLGHEEMSLKQRVRSDGRIALLLIGDVEAKGKRPSALKAELEGRLKDYIVSPNVAVNIDDTQPANVLVLGEVSKPGVVPLDPDPRLAHVIAASGGLTDYASRSAIFVVRSEPRSVRIRFTYDAITRNLGGAADFELHRGDIVEVE
jgi:polysaccharide export outer membrane protein